MIVHCFWHQPSCRGLLCCLQTLTGSTNKKCINLFLAFHLGQKETRNLMRPHCNAHSATGSVLLFHTAATSPPHPYSAAFWACAEVPADLGRRLWLPWRQGSFLVPLAWWSQEQSWGQAAVMWCQIFPPHKSATPHTNTSIRIIDWPVLIPAGKIMEHAYVFFLSPYSFLEQPRKCLFFSPPTLWVTEKILRTFPICTNSYSIFVFVFIRNGVNPKLLKQEC